MRAIFVHNFGGPDALELVDVPTPEPGPGQIRIKVAAAAVNPVDAETRDGTLEHAIPADRMPVGVGWDVAGTVDALGAGVDGFTVGEAVTALDDRLVKDIGGYAEYVVLDADAAAHAPRTADPVAASTLPLNGITAVQSLDLIDLAPDQTVLVTGAAGAVGGYLVQLAAARGLHAVALAGTADESAVKRLGARTFVARSADPAAAVRVVFPDGVDGVIDAAELRSQVLGAVRDGGKYVNLGPLHGPVETERGVRVLDQVVHRDQAVLAELARQVDAGALTLRVADTFPLDQAAAAHELLGKGGVRGRIVLVS
ncbi:MAG TPA: NADP-dependent oxidoreductase [Jatrophihabitantaceae bacterium]|jgi:NADPH:quinone reductase-like Zn-dependent oxidoreductase